ncbi:hypothetical protein SGRI78S_05653 [Streptomyces griseus subsp. griseus]
MRHRLPDRRPLLRNRRGSLQAERPGVQVADTFVFGETEVRTGVAMVVPAERVQWPVPGGLPVVEINGKDVRR